MCSLAPAGALEFEQAAPIDRVRTLITEVLRAEKATIACSDLLASTFIAPALLATLDAVFRRLAKTVPFPRLLPGLLKSDGGRDLLVAAVANSPTLYHRVVHCLVPPPSQAKPGNEAASWEQALAALCLLAPHHAAEVRGILVRRKQAPRLVLQLTLDGCADAVDFLAANLRDRDGSAWFTEFLLTANVADKARLAAAVSTRARDAWASGEVAKCSAIARIFSILYRQSGVNVLTAGADQHSVPEKEYSSALDFLTSAIDDTTGGGLFVKLALCSLVTCPQLSLPRCQERIVQWFRELLGRRNQGDGGECRLMLLLMTVHFFAGNIRAVADLVREILGFRVDVPAESLQRVSGLLTTQVFTEQVLASESLKQPVTEGLKFGTQGFLPVHCVYHVLCSRLYVKHNLDPTNWIVQQIEAAASTDGLCPILPNLVQALADLTIDPFGSGLSGNERPPRKEEQKHYTKAIPAIEQQALGRIFSGTNISAQVLALLYVLTVNDSLTKGTALGGRVRPGAGRFVLPPQYPPEFLATIPVKRLLSCADAESVRFVDVYPSLLAMATDAFPQMFDVGQLLLGGTITHDPEALPGLSLEAQITCDLESWNDIPTSALETQVAVADPVNLFARLQVLIRRPLSEVERNADWLLDTVLPEILGPSAEHRTLLAFETLWCRLNKAMPEALWQRTASACLVASGDMAGRKMSHETFCQDPLQVLRASDVIFRKPSMVRILLTILTAYMAISDAGLRNVKPQTPGSDGPATAEELLAQREPLILAQKVAVVHVLLDVCADEIETPHGLPLESKKEIFAYIHQMFIATSALPKVVHFQGYPHAILPLVVAAVPSMHVCIDFLEELMARDELEKKIFGVRVSGALAQRYRIPKMLEVCRAVIGLMVDMTSCERSIVEAFFAPTLAGLGEICKAFPLLAHSALDVLLRLQRSDVVETRSFGIVVEQALTVIAGAQTGS